ncbi:MAG: methylated-DNA--[protein]-cysteine S-methyltransferase [Sandaracinaceae bacterium]|nr:methylated-DNA--[protein]-cysteine S-methyltransferase [Sandaracinaceae bacterium]
MPDQGTKDVAARPLGPAGQCVIAAGALGRLWIAWAPDGVVQIELSGEPAPEAVWRRRLPELAALPERDAPASVADLLARYFAGEPVDPATLPVRLAGTKFQERAWRALRAVPRGAVRTYAGLAADVGSPRATRAIGTAMGANPLPIIVPCHRCVASGSMLGGYSGGLDKKRYLLELEGVRVEGDRVLLGQLDLL